MPINEKRLNALLYEALETEQGGVEVYETAVKCAVESSLRKEWTKYLKQTRRHLEIVQDVFEAFELDPDVDPPGRLIVRELGACLVSAMTDALEAGDARAAETIACECVVLAETKDHLNWKLLSECAKHLSGERRRALLEAVDQVEDEEDEHLYHTAGWTRELWLKSLGLKAVVPPPEEQKDVKTAIGAARAVGQRNRMKSEPAASGKR